jgi:ribose transport system permease protein
VNRVRIGAYAVNGFCVGLASLLMVARNGNAEPGGAIGYELDAIAAAVVGGTSLLGGYGNMLGTLVGALFITCLNVLINLRGIDDKLGMGLKGPILLLAVYLQNWGRKQ